MSRKRPLSEICSAEESILKLRVWTGVELLPDVVHWQDRTIWQAPMNFTFPTKARNWLSQRATVSFNWKTQCSSIWYCVSNWAYLYSVYESWYRNVTVGSSGICGLHYCRALLTSSFVSNRTSALWYTLQISPTKDMNFAVYVENFRTGKLLSVYD